MKKLLLGFAALPLICVSAYADITDQVYLNNASLNNVSYKASQATSLVAPNTGTILQYEINTSGVCEGDDKTVKYNITVINGSGQTLCTFTLNLSIANDIPFATAPNKNTKAQCTIGGTSGSAVKGKIENMKNANPTFADSSTTDVCSAKWIGKNETDKGGYYKSGQVLIAITSETK